jgi:hypothetical protein
VDAFPRAVQPQAEVAVAGEEAAPAAPKAAGRTRRGSRGGRGRSKAKAAATAGVAPNEEAALETTPRAKRPRRSRAKTAAPPADEA